MITRRLLRHFLPIDDSGSMGPSLRRDDDWMCDTRLHSLEFPIQFSNSRTHSPTRIRSRAPRGLCLPIGPSNHEGRWSAARRNGNCRRSCVRSRANLRSASPCGAPPTPLDPPAEGGAIVRRARAFEKAPRCGVSGRGSVQVGSAKRGGVHARGRRNQSASASPGHGLGRLPRPGGLTPPFSLSRSGRRKRPRPHSGGTFAPPSALRRSPQAASPRSGSGRSTSAARGVCASHARGRRTSFRFKNASGSAPHE